MLYFRR